MRHVLGLIVAIVMLAGTTASQAFDLNIERWYIEGRGGLGLPPSPATSFTGTQGEYEPDDGYSIAGAIGAYIGPQTRAEIEVGVTKGEGGNFVIGGVNIPHTGEAHAYSVLFNIHQEVANVNEMWRPYVGAGIGFAHYDIDNLGGGAFFVNDTATTFNAAGHFGIDVPLNEMFVLTSRLTVGITTDADFDTTNPAITVEKDTEFYAFFSAGIRFHLDQLIPLP